MFVSALTVGGVLYLLNAAWGFGSKELAAPQAMLMKMIVEGVITANLPWDLVFMGAAITVAVSDLTSWTVLFPPNPDRDKYPDKFVFKTYAYVP